MGGPDCSPDGPVGHEQASDPAGAGGSMGSLAPEETAVIRSRRVDDLMAKRG